MDTKTYKVRMQTLLSPAERTLFQKLSTPKKIQDYLDTLHVNFEEDAVDTVMSPRRVIRTKKAHCIEAALLAAAALAYHGRPAYLMDFQTKSFDEDHVVAVFKEKGYWGAISKTNHAILKWRDPIYASPRELAMSYFHEYYMDDGRKTMLAYSKPFNMCRFAPERWLVAEEELEWVAEVLDDSPHVPAAPEALLRTLRPVSSVEKQLLKLVEERDPRKC